MRNTTSMKTTWSQKMFSRKADLNHEIKRCGLRARFAQCPEEKEREVAMMDALYLTALNEGLQDAYAHRVMIQSLGQAGQIDRALTLYREIQYKNCYIHAAMLQSLRENGRFSTLFSIYCELIHTNTEVDSHIFSIVISAAKFNGQLNFAKRVYRDASEKMQLTDYVVKAYGNTDVLIQQVAVLPATQPIENNGAIHSQSAPLGVNRMTSITRAFLFPFAEPKLPVSSKVVGGLAPI